MGLIPGLGRSPGEGNGYLLQYSCLRIPWTEEPGRSPWGWKESDTTEHTHMQSSQQHSEVIIQLLEKETKTLRG